VLLHVPYAEGDGNHRYCHQKPVLSHEHAESSSCILHVSQAEKAAYQVLALSRGERTPDGCLNQLIDHYDQQYQAVFSFSHLI
jgi:hypothetical protein